MDKDQMEGLFHVLTEIAYGNYAYRLKKSGINNEYDTLATLINTISENVEGREFMNGGRDSHYSMLTFILDRDFRIETVNDIALQILDRNPEELTGQPFTGILTETSQDYWQYLKEKLLQNPSLIFHDKLTFNVHKWEEVPAHCSLTRLRDADVTCITSVKIRKRHTALEDLLEKIPSGPQETGKHIPLPDMEDSEKKIIREVGEYICENLEEPLPPVNKIARNFGINREKLRDGFKKHFNLSIYKYYTEKRLERAMHLIRHTDMSIREIAMSTGYKVSSSFYRAFRLKYKCTPGEIRQ